MSAIAGIHSPFVSAQSRTRSLPVLALTAYSRLEDRERALRAGFDLHLGKPVEPFALVCAVARAAGRSGPILRSS